MIRKLCRRWKTTANGVAEMAESMYDTFDCLRELPRTKTKRGGEERRAVLSWQKVMAHHTILAFAGLFFQQNQQENL